jgi:fido (protein-threonine AMPylation protein)
MSNNILKNKLTNSDVEFMIEEAFMGYKYRKENNQLYDINASIPTTLIKKYYEIYKSRISFDIMKESFVTRYILNESFMEDVNNKSKHGKAEIEGLREMYQYINSKEINNQFNIFTIKDLHKRLFSHVEHPEFGGTFRNIDVCLKDEPVELCEWSMIYPRLRELDDFVGELHNSAKCIKESNSGAKILDYLDKCVILNSKLIKIHPFLDGNGRTIRGFTNKMFEDVSLPPVYISSSEREEYFKAINKANNENDYQDLCNFYKYKICDSIIELDINVKNNSRVLKKTV